MRGNEFGNSGFFDSLDKAESYVSHKWDGVDIFGPDQIRPPFGVKKSVKIMKKRTVKKRTAKEQNVKKKATRKR